MDLKTILPLISTIVGGLIAIAGVFIANLISQKFTRSNDRKNLIREKLEEAYRLTIQLDQWFQTKMEMVIRCSEDKNAQIDNPIDQIIMLLKCYSPEDTEIADKLAKSILRFKRACFNHFDMVFTDGNKEKTFLVASQLNESSRKLNMELQNNIEKIIRRNT